MSSAAFDDQPLLWGGGGGATAARRRRGSCSRCRHQGASGSSVPGQRGTCRRRSPRWPGSPSSRRLAAPVNSGLGNTRFMTVSPHPQCFLLAVGSPSTPGATERVDPDRATRQRNGFARAACAAGIRKSADSESAAMTMCGRETTFCPCPSGVTGTARVWRRASESHRFLACAWIARPGEAGCAESCMKSLPTCSCLSSSTPSLLPC